MGGKFEGNYRKESKAMETGKLQSTTRKLKEEVNSQRERKNLITLRGNGVEKIIKEIFTKFKQKINLKT